MVAKELLKHDDDEAGNGGRDGGGHDGARGLRRVARLGQAEGGARVEAVPAEPEHEGARHDQGRRVAGHRERLLLLVKAAHAGAHDGRAYQGGDAARHVHDARAGKIDRATAERAFRSPFAAGAIRRRPAAGPVSFREGGEESVVGPHPVGDDRVDEAGDHGGVHEVAGEGGALGHRARHDGGRRRGEDELEEPVGHVVAVRVVVAGAGRSCFGERGLEEEVGRVRAIHVGHAHEAISRVVLRGERAGAVGEACEASGPVGLLGSLGGAKRARARAHGLGAHRKGVAPRPPDQGADAAIENVLEQDVLRVLGTHGAGLDEREAELHEEDEGAGNEEPKRVHRFAAHHGAGIHEAINEDIDFLDRRSRRRHLVLLVLDKRAIGVLVGWAWKTSERLRNP